jgi:hypothetical protein
MPDWLRIVDAALGLAEVATRRMSGRLGGSGVPRRGDLAVGSTSEGPLEARLAAVVVAALKEAFDRDNRRLDLEREQMEAERQRAERALRLELWRQAGEREIGRLRLVAGLAAGGWLGTLLFSPRLVGDAAAPRAVLTVGWLLLLGALGAAFTGQSRVARLLSRGDDAGSSEPPMAGLAGRLAPWMVVAGLAATAASVLFGSSGA